MSAVLAERMRRNREADEARRKPPMDDAKIDRYFASRNAVLKTQGLTYCA